MYWTPDELAKLLRVGPAMIRAMCKGGKLAARKVGRSWRIPDRVVRQTFPELYEEQAPPAA
ncbi:MAG TPA: helix-turn-helix domain-containing protein [bacterium]|nr:helix-turn-helix domain-containing protein [bacterium]